MKTTTASRVNRPDDSHLMVRFNPATVTTHVAYGPKAGAPYGVVLHFVEAPRKTPTGGRYTARQFTLRDPDGVLWWGSLKASSVDRLDSLSRSRSRSRSDGTILVRCRKAVTVR